MVEFAATFKMNFKFELSVVMLCTETINHWRNEKSANGANVWPHSQSFLCCRLSLWKPPTTANRLCYNCFISFACQLFSFLFGMFFLLLRFFVPHKIQKADALFALAVCALFNFLRKSYDLYCCFLFFNFGHLVRSEKKPNHPLIWCIKLSFLKNRAIKFTLPMKSTFTFHPHLLNLCTNLCMCESHGCQWV